jgi:hypothetical protein
MKTNYSKFTKYLLVLTVSIFFISCNNDDDDTLTTTPSLIVGSWNLDSLNEENVVQTTSAGNTESETIISESRNENYIVSFSETSDIISTVGSYDLLETTTTSIGIVTTETFTGDTFFIENATWIITGGLLTVDESGDSFSLTIDELTANSLVLSNTRTITETDNSGAVPSTETVTQTTSIRFSR